MSNLNLKLNFSDRHSQIEVTALRRNTSKASTHGNVKEQKATSGAWMTCNVLLQHDSPNHRQFFQHSSLISVLTHHRNPSSGQQSYPRQPPSTWSTYALRYFFSAISSHTPEKSTGPLMRTPLFILVNIMVFYPSTSTSTVGPFKSLR